MTEPSAASTDLLTEQLIVLAADLERLGLRARTLPGRQPPCLRVTNPQVAQLSEVIYAAKSRDGGTWFWWSWGERIDDITNAQAVASRIARVLS